MLWKLTFSKFVRLDWVFCSGHFDHMTLPMTMIPKLGGLLVDLHQITIQKSMKSCTVGCPKPVSRQHYFLVT